MSEPHRRHFLYILFLLLMMLILAAGVALMIYGSLHNGVSLPRWPGQLPRLALQVPHG